MPARESVPKKRIFGNGTTALTHVSCGFFLTLLASSADRGERRFL
jgi:hypothetical protein